MRIASKTSSSSCPEKACWASTCCGRAGRTRRPAAEWLASAESAGCVDTLVFRDGGDRVPLGANVTVDSFIDLFAQFAVHPRGTTLVHGAGHTARSLISALHILGVAKVLVYDPRPGRSNTMVANVQASAGQPGLVEGVDDFASAFEVADGFADCLNPAAGPPLGAPDGTVRWWFDGPGRLLGAGQPRATRLLPGWCLSVHRAAPRDGFGSMRTPNRFWSSKRSHGCLRPCAIPTPAHRKRPP